MTHEEYAALPGLSNSGMKDLEVSPLRYWHKHINPNRPKDEPTPAMAIGTALHCAVLEPNEFEKRYACELSPADYEGCLVTVEDIKGYIRERGAKPKAGVPKAELIRQAQELDPNVVIFDRLQADFSDANLGKTFLRKGEWENVRSMADALLSVVELRQVLSGGHAEVPLSMVDEQTNVRYKGRLDYIGPDLIVDVKTFSQRAGNTISKSITDAIYYEKYYRQSYLYSKLGKAWDGKRRNVLLAFVESEAPYDVRLRLLKPKFGAVANVYWSTAEVEILRLTRMYAECCEIYGAEPWRHWVNIDELTDDEVPQFAWR